ncbi:MAG TPA: DUF2382 domain-containing protein [Bryobacteraceae bacterium]|jgi:hypothetical protein|nr:DUF2382 domain-containing protein [Bryobacteraceae bacterium]
MAELQEFPLVTTSGRTGRVWRASRFLDRNQTNAVELDDGARFEVPSADLKIRADGTFVLNEPEESFAAPAEPETVSEPINVSEPVYPTPPPVSSNGNSGGAVFTIDEPLASEEVEVERVAVNRIIDGPPETRQEGEVTIIPVVEEVITIQKRLLLKEEVRITRKRKVIREPRQIRMGDSPGRVIGADGRDIQS